MYRLLLVYSIATIAIIAFPQYYINELLISFLPYIGIILFFLVIITVIIFIRSYSKKSLFKKRLIWSIVILSIFTAFFTNYQRLSFYQARDYSSQTDFDKTKEEIGLSFYFANILKSNDDYEEIKKTITDLNPDVALFVEYSQEHDDNISDFMSQNYKYINRIPWTQEIVWNVIFSKYPLEDFAPKVFQWPRRYGYVAISHESKTYYFYLVHTSAPVNYEYYVMRNNQMDLFAENFIEQDISRLPDDRVVVVGDFNVTPRSPTFKTFENIITTASSQMSHTWRFTSLRFSRWLNKRWETDYPYLKSFIRSHIDHLWISKTTTLYNIQKVPINWSDHDGIFARIY